METLCLKLKIKSYRLCSFKPFLCCKHACYCVNMVSVTSASRYITSATCYHPRYQSRSSMYIRSLIPRTFAELAAAVPIAFTRAFELRHEKTTSREDSHQPRLQLSLNSLCCPHKDSLGPWFTHCVHSKDSDQTGQMPRLI